VHGQRQPAEHLCRVRITFSSLNSPFHLTETQTQGDVFIRVAELTEETANFFGASSCQSDNAKRGLKLRLALGNALEQGALEVATTRRPFRVQLASIIVAQGRARLGKSNRPLFLRTGPHRSFHHRFRARELERQTKTCESFCVITGLQLDVLEENSITAKAAMEAELLRN
jgi:hypothetical protein